MHHILILISISFLISNRILNSVYGQIPSDCVANTTQQSPLKRVCCPSWPGLGVCGGPKRGSCTSIVEDAFLADWPNVRQLPKQMRRDIRLFWPTVLMSRVCQCHGRFWGVACESCWFGWKGANCDEPDRRVRRNVLSLNESERKKLIGILLRSHELMTKYKVLVEKREELWDPKRSEPIEFVPVTVQYLMSAIHRFASRSTLFRDDQMCRKFGYFDLNHDTASFLLWHRGYVLLWERFLAKIAADEFDWPDFAVPYWDWIDAKTCKPCVNDLFGGVGKFVHHLNNTLINSVSPFSKVTEYCTEPEFGNNCYGCHARRSGFVKLNRRYTHHKFPDTSDLLFTLSSKIWYLAREGNKCASFHKRLEGFCGRPDDHTGLGSFMHNRIHNMVHGSVCCASTASNDPLFLVHHSQIDRIVECWFQKNRPRPSSVPTRGIRPGNCPACNLVGIYPLIKHENMFVSMRDLGISYDNYRFGHQGYICKAAKPGW